MDTQQIIQESCSLRGMATKTCLWLLALGSAASVVSAFASPSSTVQSLDIDLVAVGGGRSQQKGRNSNRLSTTLDMVASESQSSYQDQKNEFEINVGHAMDVLRSDYPDILHHKPDFSIYDSDLELIDPTGVKLHGLKNYKTSFQLVHAIISIFYCPERSGLTFRMCYDKARQNIRIHWNAQVIPKAMFGGYKSTLHVDGISVYEISPTSGNITQHRIERLLIDDTPVTPEQGIFAALRGHAREEKIDSIPVWNVHSKDNQILEFHNFYPGSRSFLFNSEDVNEASEQQQRRSMQSDAANPMEGGTNSFDHEALEKKNLARKKFGLKPLTPEEFQDLQEKVTELDNQQQQRAAAAAAELQANKEKEEKGGFFKKLMGGVLEDTCTSNYDCESPEVCCDFGFKKMCCSSGMRVLDGPPRSRYGDLAEIPVIANPGPSYPPNGGGGDPYGGGRGQW